MSINAAESFRCPSCDNCFSFPNWEGPRIPQLLQCAHSICKSCVELQEPGQARCAKCHELTEFNANKGLPKNFYLLGLLFDWQQNQSASKESIDESKECQCGKVVATRCDRCDVLLCLPCFEDTHNRGFLRKHKLVDPGRVKADAKIQQLKAKVASSACEEKNKKHLPELRKLKESLFVVLEESQATFEKFELQRDEYKAQCDEACRSVDVKIEELIAVLQNTAKERKSELQTAFEKHQNRLEREVNKENWLQDLNDLRAAVNSIEDILNNNEQNLDYKEYIGLLVKSVPKAVRKLNIPPIDSNLFGIEIDDEMEPRKVRKRIKIYTKIPVGESSTLRDCENWMSFPLTEIKAPAVKPKKKSQESVKTPTQPPPSAEKPQTKPKYHYRLLTSPANKVGDESSSESSCFSDEEDLKAARKASKKKSSTSDTGSVKIIHQKSDLSLGSHIDESMLARETIPRQKVNTRGTYKPTYTSFAPNNNNNNSKFKSVESHSKKFDIPDKALIQFNYFDAKISYFSSFDEFYVHQVEPEYMVETNRLAKEINSYFSDPANHKLCLFAKVSFFGVFKFADVWHRCTVLRVHPDHYEIFLVDVGRKMKIPKAELKVMPNFLTKYPKVAIKCKLADIRKSPDSSCYTEKAIKSFKKLAMSSNGTMSVCVVKEAADKSDAIPVVIYTFPNNGLRVNLNAYLAESFDCVVSTGQNSVGIFSKDETAEPLKKSPIRINSAPLKTASKKMEVEMLAAESPGKFYASFKKQGSEDQNLLIQNDALMLSSYQKLKDKAKQDWKNGDYCYLKWSFDNMDPKWFRGRVADTSDPLDIFLIDKGLSIKINSDQLIDAPNCVPSNRPPAAKKMHLAEAIPLGDSDSWNRSTVEQFKKVIQAFSKFCVSDVGDVDSEGSLPVKLWGVTTTDAIITNQQEYHDIGAYLTNEGYLDRKSTPSKTDGQTNAVLDDVDLSNTPHPIDGWTPAVPAQVGEFQGVPTEVDENGVIYIQSREQHAQFNDLKVNLTSKYLVYDIERTSIDPKVGKAVIVHQKITGEFHRGVIEKIIKETVFKVRLVDTGTVELVNYKDIYMNVVSEEIPVLCNKFRLASVVPLNVADCAWPAETLEFIHGQLVDRGVTVVVTEVGEINNCSIRIDEKFQEIETILIDGGMARWRKLDDAWPANRQSDEEDAGDVDVFVKEHLASMQAKVREERLDQIANALLKPESVEVSPEVTKHHLRSFEQDCNKEISESVISLGSKSLKSLKSTSSLRKPASKATIRTFNAFETLSSKARSRKRTGYRPPKQIHFFDLQAADIDRFRCTFTNVHSKTKLYVTPQIQELQEKIEDLDRALESLDDAMLVKFRHIQDAVNEMCLVELEQKWNRAMITSVSADDQLVDVFLLDSTKCATVDAENVFKMDLKLQKFPKKTLVVVLDGLKAHPSLEDHAIEKLVASTLKNRNLKAIVKCHDDKNFPVVELKDENDCLAYQTLIDNKVFIPIAV